MQSPVGSPLRVADDTKLYDAEDRNFRVHYVFEHAPDRGTPGIICVHIALCVHRHTFVIMSELGSGAAQ